MNITHSQPTKTEYTPCAATAKWERWRASSQSSLARSAGRSQRHLGTKPELVPLRINQEPCTITSLSLFSLFSPRPPHPLELFENLAIPRPQLELNLTIIYPVSCFHLLPFAKRTGLRTKSPSDIAHSGLTNPRLPESLAFEIGRQNGEKSRYDPPRCLVVPCHGAMP
jgi:hypothetical protein